MFNIFAAKKHAAVEVVNSTKPAQSLLSRMSAIIEGKQHVLDAQGDEHGDIDLRLVERIDEILEPYIGPSDLDEAVWFQSMDYHGGGIRLLEFKPGSFPFVAIPQLQALLVGEHAAFCILCWILLEHEVTPEEAQGMVIFSDKLLFTPKIAARLASAETAV